MSVGLACRRDVVNGFVNETRRNCRDGVRRGAMAGTGELIVTCAFETGGERETRDRLAHNPEVADPYLVLATSGNASGGLRPWRLSCRS